MFDKANQDIEVEKTTEKDLGKKPPKKVSKNGNEWLKAKVLQEVVLIGRNKNPRARADNTRVVINLYSASSRKEDVSYIPFGLWIFGSRTSGNIDENCTGRYVRSRKAVAINLSEENMELFNIFLRYVKRPSLIGPTRDEFLDHSSDVTGIATTPIGDDKPPALTDTIPLNETHNVETDQKGNVKGWM